MVNLMQSKTYKSYDEFKKAISDCFVRFVHDDKAPSILNIKDLGVQDEKDSEDDF